MENQNQKAPGKGGNSDNRYRQFKDTETRKIYQALAEVKQPKTRRELSKLTGLEISSLCRALWNLIHYPRTIKISHYAPCKTTGKRVMHFYFNREGAQDGK